MTQEVLTETRTAMDDVYEFEIPRGADELAAENYDAAESGSFTPRIMPGTQARFRFQLTPIKDPTTKLPIPGGFGKVVGDGGTLYDSAEYTAHFIVADMPDEAFVAGRPTVPEVAVRFNRISNAPSRKGLSGFGEMYRSLGLIDKHGALKGSAQIAALVQASKDGASAWGEIGWRYYDKASGVTYTTHPFKKSLAEGKHVAWPLDDAGRPKPSFMLNGQNIVGREIVAAILAPRIAKSSGAA